MTTNIEERLEALEKSVKALTDAIPASSRIRVRWRAKKTDSGIEIQGGPTFVEKEGLFLGTEMMPDPNNPQQAALGVVVLGDDNMISIMGVGGVQFV